MPSLDFLLAPPLAFLIYLGLVAILSGMGRALAGPVKASRFKAMTYASGEAPPLRLASPGYRPFFVVALFFAVLHLGILILGTSDLSAFAGIYLFGLLLALVALILG